MASWHKRSCDNDPKELTAAIHEEFRKQMFGFWENGVFTDLEIKNLDPNGRLTVYRVHKIVVCSASLFFKQLLETDLNLEQSSVTITGVDSVVLRTLLDFVYTGELILSDLTYSELKDLPLVANNLGIFSVGNAFITGLCKSVNIYSLPVMMEIQAVLHSKELEEAICDCVVAELPEFSTVMNARLSRDEMHGVLAKATQLGTSPDILLQTAIAWVNHNPNLRKKDMEGLLARIQFESLPQDFVSFLIEDKVMMKEYPFLLRRLTELMLPGCCLSPTHILLKARRCKSDTVLCVKKPSVSPRKRVKKCHTDCVAIVPRYSPARHGLASCPPIRPPVFKDVGYAVIGRDESNRASIMFCKLIGNEWSPLEDLGQSIDRRQAIAYSDDRIYFIGGEDMHGEKMDRCDMYDLVTKEMRRLPDMRIKRLMPVVVVYHQVVFVAGGVGRFHNNWMSHMETLDGPCALAWKNAAPLRVRRNDEASCCIFEDRIYVVGGGTNKCECYDLRREGWQLVAPLPYEFTDLVILTAVTAHRLYAFHYFKPNTIYWLDTDEQVWREQHTKGNGPEWVLLAVGVANKIIALDKARYIYMYETMSNYWHKVRKLPRVMLHAVTMVPINPFLVKDD